MSQIDKSKVVLFALQCFVVNWCNK